MDLFRVLLVVSTLLCSLVAGFVFAFATVVMPGIRTLGDRTFLDAFKVMDRVIQDTQPLFMLVWVGSVVTLVVAGVLGLWRLDGAERILLVLAAGIYLLGVQLPTATINVPLNNQLQAQNLATMSGTDLRDARGDFESRWVRWNTIRTFNAISTTLLLIILMLRLEWLSH